MVVVVLFFLPLLQDNKSVEVVTTVISSLHLVRIFHNNNNGNGNDMMTRTTATTTTPTMPATIMMTMTTTMTMKRKMQKSCRHHFCPLMMTTKKVQQKEI